MANAAAPPPTLLGLGREHIPWKYQSLFQPGDLILLRGREPHSIPTPPEPVPHLGICKTCITDHSCGLLTLLALATFGIWIIQWASDLARGSVVFLIAAMMVPLLLLDALDYWIWFVFVFHPRPGDTFTYYHPYDKLLCGLFDRHALAEMYDFWHGPSVFRRFYGSLHGSSLVSWFHDPYGPSYIPIETRMEYFDRGSLLLRLSRYPDLFTSRWLDWLNEIYLTYRDWQRWEAAGQVYAELELEGRLRAPGFSDMHIPLVEYSMSALEEITGVAEATVYVFLEVDPEYHMKHVRGLT